MGSNREKLTTTNINGMVEILREHCIDKKLGGPFAAIIMKDGEVVGVGVNTVTSDRNPTRHAEMNAIDDACATLNTCNLKGCEIYTTGYPCPMCMAAIIWSGIKKVYYSANYKDAKKLGFRDDLIYKFIKNGCKNTETLEFEQLNKESIINLYKEYKQEGEIY